MSHYMKLHKEARICYGAPYSVESIVLVEATPLQLRLINFASAKSHESTGCVWDDTPPPKVGERRPYIEDETKAYWWCPELSNVAEDLNIYAWNDDS